MKSIYVLIVAGTLCLSSQQLFTMYKGKNNTVNYINYNNHASKNAQYKHAKYLKKVSTQQKNWEQQQQRRETNQNSMIMSFCTPQERKNTYGVDPIDSIIFLASLQQLQNTNTLR